jgi:1,4-alpha-glucan branching enzyme
VVLNFTPVPREGYRLGVPEAGNYREIFNSDSEFYGGSNIGNAGLVATEPHAWMGFNNSISITLPPLGALILQP